MAETARDRGYAHPVLAGFALGLVLLGSILVAGRGLGASGAFASASAAAVRAVAPAHAASHPYLSTWLADGSSGLLGDWIVVELLAVFAGGWLSAALARRLHRGVERIGGESKRARLLAALGGGALMGAGARLAKGCTSGLGLTGGALLSSGAWLFIPVAFGSAVLFALLRSRAGRAAGT
jgi:hypothetical protein